MKNKLVIAIGETGSGKSYLLNQLSEEEDIFEVGDSCVNECTIKVKKFPKGDYVYVDTHGFHGNENGKIDAYHDLMKFSPIDHEIQSIIMVHGIDGGRMGKMDKVKESLKDVFGEEALANLLIYFSKCDDLKEEILMIKKKIIEKELKEQIYFFSDDLKELEDHIKYMTPREIKTNEEYKNKVDKKKKKRKNKKKKRNQKPKEVFETIKDRINLKIKNVNVEKAGSLAKKTDTEYSDLDIVVYHNKINQLEFIQKKDEIMMKLKDVIGELVGQSIVIKKKKYALQFKYQGVEIDLLPTCRLIELEDMIKQLSFLEEKYLRLFSPWFAIYQIKFIDEKLQEYLRKLNGDYLRDDIRKLKEWAGGLNWIGSKPISYLIELIVIEIYQRLEKSKDKEFLESNRWEILNDIIHEGVNKQLKIGSKDNDHSPGNVVKDIANSWNNILSNYRGKDKKMWESFRKHIQKVENIFE